jgi:hypothetical protein
MAAKKKVQVKKTVQQKKKHPVLKLIELVVGVLTVVAVVIGLVEKDKKKKKS